MPLGFLDKVKDGATRLIPTPFAELVEQTTDEKLLAPDWERNMFLVDQANQNPDNAKDVVRAVRRRIDSKSPKVQYYTVKLLDTLVKNGGPDVHNEVATTKGLVSDLLALATQVPMKPGDVETKKAAMQTILTMSVAFSGHPNEKVRGLADLADAARASGEHFEEMEPELMSPILTNPTPAPSPTQRRGPPPAAATQSTYGATTAASRAQQQPRHMVDAIPVEQIPAEQVSTMCDTVALLAEMINHIPEEAAKSPGTNPLQGNDVVLTLARQVRTDHRRVSVLVSSGANLENMEMLLALCDSQVDAIEKLGDLNRAYGQQQQAEQGAAGGAGAPAAGTVDATPTMDQLLQGAQQQPPGGPTTRTASDTDFESFVDGRRRTVEAKPVVAQGNVQQGQQAPAPSAPPQQAVTLPVAPAPPKASAVNMDDLFGGYTEQPTAPPPTTPPPPVPAPAPQTSETDEREALRREAEEARRAAAAALAMKEEADRKLAALMAMQEQQQQAQQEAAAQRRQDEDAKKAREAQAERQEAQAQQAAAALAARAAADEEAAAKAEARAREEKEQVAKAEAAAASNDGPSAAEAAPTGSLNAEEDGEFDAFLNSRLQK